LREVYRLIDNCSMGVRGFVGVLLAVLMPGLAHAADCIAVQHDDVTIASRAGCDDLRLMSRPRDDARPDIPATWIEFVRPAGPGEWRYNDWIKRQVATLHLERPMAVVLDLRREDRFAVRSFYRSDRLISARYGHVMCCGGKSDTIYSSINVDIRRWTLLSPDDLVSLGGAANACWKQFGQDKSRGTAFAGAWPVERLWVDRDFETGRPGFAMREIIGPVVIDPEPSKKRSERVFASVLTDQSRWSFSEQGASVDFGDLLGPGEGPFFCTLKTAELKAIALPGVPVPP